VNDGLGVTPNDAPEVPANAGSRRATRGAIQRVFAIGKR
jgi:hypothetical protein